MYFYPGIIQKTALEYDERRNIKIGGAHAKQIRSIIIRARANARQTFLHANAKYDVSPIRRRPPTRARFRYTGR